MPEKPIHIIVECDHNGGIGKNNTIPWKNTKDIIFFKKTTIQTQDKNKKNAVIMGKNTWFSLPKKPLPFRENVVITSNSQNIPSNIITFSSVEDAIYEMNQNENIENIFIIGGAKLYDYCLKLIPIDTIYYTKINETYDCDTFFTFDETRWNKKIVSIDTFQIIYNFTKPDIDK
jgi:dihydrofolate reductase